MMAEMMFRWVICVTDDIGKYGRVNDIMEV